MRGLNLKRADVYPRVSEHIPEIIDLVRETVSEDGRCEVSEFRDELRIIISPEDLLSVVKTLKDSEPFYFLHLSDVTAVDYPDRDGPRFDVVYQLYSFKLNMRIRIKLRVDEDEEAAGLDQGEHGVSAYPEFTIESGGEPVKR